jgi:peroxiredoxin
MYCREELPHIIDMYQKYHAAGLQVAYITDEDAESARQFAKANSLPFPVLIDTDHRVASQFQVDSLPVSVLLDKQGRAAGALYGWSPDHIDDLGTLAGQVVKE